MVAFSTICAFQVGLMAAPSYAGSNGCGGQQKDDNIQEPSSNYTHNWLGYCEDASGWPWIRYWCYDGVDDRSSWGGSYHQVSYEYVHLRAWQPDNSTKYFDQTNTLYNSTTTDSLNSPWSQLGNFASPHTDSYVHITQNGVFDHTNYFNY
jgi:hypothetical protein